MQANDYYTSPVSQDISTALLHEICIYIRDSTSKTWEKEKRDTASSSSSLFPTVKGSFNCKYQNLSFCIQFYFG